MSFSNPDRNCPLCPRLVSYREAYRLKHPDWHNAPVQGFGGLDAKLLVIGQAPGVNGANRTGRPFTGDYAGHLLYATLLKFGFAQGHYAESADDGLQLVNCRITNAVRCAPPQHKVEPSDKHHCHQFLIKEISAMPNLSVILTLGGVAHDMGLRALAVKPSTFKFTHGAMHEPKAGLYLANSYHVSRYNTSTKRLSTDMFEAVVSAIKQKIL